MREEKILESRKVFKPAKLEFVMGKYSIESGHFPVMELEKERNSEKRAKLNTFLQGIIALASVASVIIDIFQSQLFS